MTETVTVASKLELDQIIDLNGKSYTLKGKPALPEDGTFPEGFDLQHGFSLTHGIPKDFWEAWSAAYADWAPLRDGLIFADVKRANVEAYAKNAEKQKSGFERIDKNQTKKYGITDAKGVDADAELKA